MGEPIAICVNCASKYKLALGEVVEMIACVCVVSWVNRLLWPRTPLAVYTSWILAGGFALKADADGNISKECSFQYWVVIPTDVVITTLATTIHTPIEGRVIVAQLNSCSCEGEDDRDWCCTSVSNIRTWWRETSGTGMTDLYYSCE